MKKMALTWLAVIMVLFSLSIAAYAEQPDRNVAGVWHYWPYLEHEEIRGGNIFWETFEEGEWEGTFEGTSTEDGLVVVHRSGSVSFNAMVSFDGTVGGESGTLEMSVVGKCCDESVGWQGKWVILSGTEGLASLRGQGTWWGLGAADWGEEGLIDYSGQIHFRP